MLKKLLKVLANFLLFVGATAIIFGAYIWYSGSKNSEESEKFAKEAMTAIAKDWQAKELLDRYNPKARKQMDQTKLQRNMETLREWGGLQSLANVDGHMPLNTSVGNNPESVAVYRGDLMLEKGKAIMRLRVSKRNGQWVIDRMDICNASTKAAEECSLDRTEITKG